MYRQYDHSVNSELPRTFHRWRTPSASMATHDVVGDGSQQSVKDLRGLLVALEEIAIIRFRIHWLRHDQQRFIDRRTRSSSSIASRAVFCVQ